MQKTIKRHSTQTRKVEKVPRFSNQLNTEFERFLTSPILLPALCKPAVLRAAMYSLSGIRYKEYLTSKIYTYTSYRLERMFTKLDQYPDSVLKAWVTNRPGYVVYSKKFLGGNNIKVFRSEMTPGNVQQLISLGNIVKVEQETAMPEFESYVYGNDFENQWIKGLPQYVVDEHRTGQVLPVFRKDVRKYILGSIKRTFGLPSWYVALEDKVDGLRIDAPGKMGPGDIMFHEMRCTPISPIKKNEGYVPWNDKMRTISRGKYCLVWDGSMVGADMQLIQNFDKHNLYRINVEGFVKLQIRINGMKIDLKTKTTTLMSDNRKVKMVHKGILTDDDNDFFFKLLFSSEDVSDQGQWNPISLKTGDEYQVYYHGMSIGFDYTDLLLVNESFNNIVMNGKRRMYVIGRKGTMKTRFMRFIKDINDDSKVKFIDSDLYGKWVLWMKRGAKEQDLFDIDDLTVGTHINYIEQLADGIMGGGRKGTKHEETKIKMFNIAYEELLKDEQYGIRKWQLFIEPQIKAQTIIYFVHSDVEIRNMIAANPTPVLITTYNPIKVLRNRDIGRTRQGQMLLGLYYDRYIPDIISHIEYKDIMMMCGMDVSVNNY